MGDENKWKAYNERKSSFKIPQPHHNEDNFDLNITDDFLTENIQDHVEQERWRSYKERKASFKTPQTHHNEATMDVNITNEFDEKYENEVNNQKNSQQNQSNVRDKFLSDNERWTSYKERKASFKIPQPHHDEETMDLNIVIEDNDVPQTSILCSLPVTNSTNDIKDDVTDLSEIDIPDRDFFPIQEEISERPENAVDMTLVEYLEELVLNFAHGSTSDPLPGRVDENFSG
jgi:hypothetical protein